MRAAHDPRAFKNVMIMSPCPVIICLAFSSVPKWPKLKRKCDQNRGEHTSFLFSSILSV